MIDLILIVGWLAVGLSIKKIKKMQKSTNLLCRFSFECVNCCQFDFFEKGGTTQSRIDEF
jgi:TPP-dependent indolepyruvate ferredoxin oxidoreductase alpha subunit